MKKTKIFVQVKNFSGINHDVDFYCNLRRAKRGFRDYTGFRFNRKYNDQESGKYSEDFSETKIYELDLPDFLRLKEEGGNRDEGKD